MAENDTQYDTQEVKMILKNLDFSANSPKPHTQPASTTQLPNNQPQIDVGNSYIEPIFPAPRCNAHCPVHILDCEA